MFPYPSGTGLHVGHPLGYIATDAYARFLRMTGHNVLHPFGYDAFGLPAEQYAISTGQHPAVTTAANIGAIQAQLRRLGLGHDERREVVTSDPSFYRWTQWIFLQIYGSWFDERVGRARPIGELAAEFAAGTRQPPGGRSWAELAGPERRDLLDGYRLAYLSEELVNWCPGLGTVLANEEVTADGRSDVGNYPVYRRPLRQWMLRITAYADRLINELDLVDWPEPVKHMQRNWIGASEGASIDFGVAGQPGVSITVFTTRPDTLPGATYLAVSPEHPLVAGLTASAWPAGTPASWRGPAAGGEDTPAARVAAYQARAAQRGQGKTGLFTGSYVINPATGEQMPVFVADYVLMDYGTGAIMAVPAHDQRDLEFARAFGLPVRAVLRPPDEWFGQHSLPAGAPAGQWPQAFTGDGRYAPVPGPPLPGLGRDAAIEATIGWLERRGTGRRERRHRLRDWLFSRQRYWGEPFPIVYDEHGPVALPESMLPVLLPEMTDFRPATADGDELAEPVPPLARVPGWGTVTLDLGDGPKAYRRELNTMPQWAGSCWYYLRYLDPANDAAFVDPAVERYWMAPGGVNLYVGGVEHAVLHLLYARFWHKVLYDLGHVSTPEPFARLLNQGYILADAFTDGRGMYVPGRRGHPGRRRRLPPPRPARHPARREDGQEPEEQHQPGRDLRHLQRRHAAAVRDGDGPAGRRPAVAYRRHRRCLPVPAATVAEPDRRALGRAQRGRPAAGRGRRPPAASDDHGSPPRLQPAAVQYRHGPPARTERLRHPGLLARGQPPARARRAARAHDRAVGAAYRRGTVEPGWATAAWRSAPRSPRPTSRWRPRRQSSSRCRSTARRGSKSRSPRVRARPRSRPSSPPTPAMPSSRRTRRCRG